MGDVLTTDDIQQLTGWSKQRIRKLIAQGKLPAKNISTGESKARFAIRRIDFEAFITPDNVAQPIRAKTSRRRIDANVPKVFG